MQGLWTADCTSNISNLWYGQYVSLVPWQGACLRDSSVLIDQVMLSAFVLTFDFDLRGTSNGVGYKRFTWKGPIRSFMTLAVLGNGCTTCLTPTLQYESQRLGEESFHVCTESWKVCSSRKRKWQTNLLSKSGILWGKKHADKEQARRLGGWDRVKTSLPPKQFPPKQYVLLPFALCFSAVDDDDDDDWQTVWWQ